MEKVFGAIKQYAIIVVFVAIAVLFTFLTPNFATFRNLMNVLRQVSMIGICVSALMCLMITGNLDLSIGGIHAFGGIVAGILIVNMGWPVWISCITSILVSSVFGVINGLMVSYVGIPALIATLAMDSVLKGITFTLTGGIPIYQMPDAMKYLGQGHIGPVPFPVVLMLIILLAVAFVLNKTYFGRYLFAVGSNVESARLSGLNTKLIKMMSYVLVSACACLSGLIMVGRVNSAVPNTGTTLGTDCMLSCVLGGCTPAGGEGRVLKVFFGVLTMGIITNGMSIIGMSDYTQMITKGLLLLFSLGLDAITNQRRAKSKVLKSA